MTITVGLQASVEITVAQADTAIALGSGDVPVLATPRLLALAEQATVAAVRDHLAGVETSVGVRVSLEHLRVTPLGGRVEVRACLVAVDGRKLRFEVSAHDSGGQLVGRGEVVRVVVDRERFLTQI